MRRILTSAIVAATIILVPGIAAASNTGASFRAASAGPIHTFTLAQARRVVLHYERDVEGLPVTMSACGWVRVHVAACALRMTATVIDGEPPSRWLLIDYVSRAGPCYGHVTRPLRGNQLGLGGGKYTHACFDRRAPLVVEPHQLLAG
jgi:hypothetical protein